MLSSDHSACAGSGVLNTEQEVRLSSGWRNLLAYVGAIRRKEERSNKIGI
jgi:hypothetical protein